MEPTDTLPPMYDQVKKYIETRINLLKRTGRIRLRYRTISGDRFKLAATEYPYAKHFHQAIHSKII